MPGQSKDPELRARQLAALAENRFVLPGGEHNHPRRCTAKAKNAGRRCRNLAMKGRNVCRFHGGRAGRPRKDGSPPVTRQDELTPARTRAKAVRMERRARSRLRRHGIEALAEMDHQGLDRDTMATARAIYARLLEARGGPFGNDTVAGAALTLCVQRAKGEIRTLREFDARCRDVLGLRLVPTEEENLAIELEMAECRAERARLNALSGRGAGGW